MRAPALGGRRAGAGRCGRRGRPARRASCVTWTSISRRTCARCCRSSRRSSRATPTWPSARDSPTARVSCAGRSASSSRAGYNHLLHATLRARLQRRAVRLQGGPARRPPRGCSTRSRDDGWFFDTSARARAAPRAAHPEVPVDWVDDPDPRVQDRRPRRGPARGRAAARRCSPMARFTAIGMLSMLAYAGLSCCCAVARRARRERVAWR